MALGLGGGVSGGFGLDVSSGSSASPARSVRMFTKVVSSELPSEGAKVDRVVASSACLLWLRVTLPWLGPGADIAGWSWRDPGQVQWMKPC